LHWKIKSIGHSFNFGLLKAVHVGNLKNIEQSYENLPNVDTSFYVKNLHLRLAEWLKWYSACLASVKARGQNPSANPVILATQEAEIRKVVI
jgi:hypothetical protein